MTTEVSSERRGAGRARGRARRAGSGGRRRYGGRPGEPQARRRCGGGGEQRPSPARVAARGRARRRRTWLAPPACGVPRAASGSQRPSSPTLPWTGFSCGGIAVARVAERHPHLGALAALPRSSKASESAAISGSPRPSAGTSRVRGASRLDAAAVVADPDREARARRRAISTSRHALALVVGVDDDVRARLRDRHLHVGEHRRRRSRARRPCPASACRTTATPSGRAGIVRRTSGAGRHPPRAVPVRARRVDRRVAAVDHRQDGHEAGDVEDPLHAGLDRLADADDEALTRPRARGGARRAARRAPRSRRTSRR